MRRETLIYKTSTADGDFSDTVLSWGAVERKRALSAAKWAASRTHSDQIGPDQEGL